MPPSVVDGVERTLEDGIELDGVRGRGLGHPGVVTNSRSSPSSLKNPLSRATRTGTSWTATISLVRLESVTVRGAETAPLTDAWF